MSTSTLQTLLENKLLDIGEDDTRFERLKNSSAALSEQLKESPHLTIPVSLAAVDTRPSPDDPAFVAAHQAVTKYWPTYRNRWPDAPIEIWKAVLLESLMISAKDNAEIASAAALTWASLLPRIRLGKEAPVILECYTTLRNTAEARSAQEWTDELQPLKIKLTKAKATPPNASLPKVNEKQLTRWFRAAVGPAGPEGALPAELKPNPYWPSNNATAWAHEFAPRAASAVSTVVDAALKDVQNALGTTHESVGGQLTQWTTAAATGLRELVVEISRSAEGARRRSKLMWWRAAMYSPQTRKSYREGPIIAASLQAALDLHTQVSAHSPESAEHFLREMVRELVRTSPPATTGADQATRGPHATSIREALQLVAQGEVVGFPEARAAVYPVGRLTLLEALQVATAAGVEASILDSLAARTGPAAESAVPLDELAAWVFRDAQAYRLVGPTTNA